MLRLSNQLLELPKRGAGVVAQGREEVAAQTVNSFLEAAGTNRIGFIFSLYGLIDAYWFDDRSLEWILHNLVDDDLTFSAPIA